MCKHSSQFLFCLQRPSPDLLLNLFCQQHHNVIASCHELGHGIGRQGCMLELCQIVQLLADHFCVLAVLVLSNVLYQRMVGIQDQGLALTAESTHIHTGHGVHLHHILHTSALFGQRDHRRDLFILQLLYLDRDLTNNLMRRLEAQGVPTHYVEELSDRETAVKKVSIVPLEVIIRNISAGSFAKRYGVEEGIVFDEPTIEFSYKNDDLGDPLLNTYHALALKLATQQEIDLIQKYAFMVNDLLKGFMKEIGIDLVDFKLEFGKTSDGTIVLADEISPDTCRLWDETTHEKLDKDRFRRDLGGAEEAYEEVMRRLMGDR